MNIQYSNEKYSVSYKMSKVPNLVDALNGCEDWRVEPGISSMECIIKEYVA